MKPSICRTKQRVYIPADEIACKEREIFIEKVNSINEVTPKAGHAYFELNGIALQQENHQVNIDLSRYALATNIPENVSELTNDSGYITNEQLAESLKGKADKIESIDFCTDADIDAIFTEDK